MLSYTTYRWLRLGLLVVLLVALGTVTWIVRQRIAKQTLVQDALRLADLGDFPEAEAKLLAALEVEPDNVDLLKALSLGLLTAERYLEAEPFLTRYCALRPDDPHPYRLRLTARHRGSMQAPTDATRFRLQEQALEDGRRVLELEPTDDVVAQEVVWLALTLGHFDEADRTCRAARLRRPQEIFLLYLQARASHARGAVIEAAALLDTLLSQIADYDRALYLRALIYVETDEPAKAVPLLRQVIDNNRAHRAEARYQLGLALARLGQSEESQRILSELQQRNLDDVTKSAGDTNRPIVLVRRAELLLEAGKLDEAIAHLKFVVKEDPTFARAHLLLALCYDKRGDKPLADEHRRKAEK